MLWSYHISFFPSFSRSFCYFDKCSIKSHFVLISFLIINEEKYFPCVQVLFPFCKFFLIFCLYAYKSLGFSSLVWALHIGSPPGHSFCRYFLALLFLFKFLHVFFPKALDLPMNLSFPFLCWFYIQIPSLFFPRFALITSARFHPLSFSFNSFYLFMYLFFAARLHFNFIYMLSNITSLYCRICYYLFLKLSFQTWFSFT